jgi:hypothetical protein
VLLSATLILYITTLSLICQGNNEKKVKKNKKNPPWVGRAEIKNVQKIKRKE